MKTYSLLLDKNSIFKGLRDNRVMKEFTEKEMLEKIHKRLGWVLFWVIFFSIIILARISDIEGLFKLI